MVEGGTAALRAREVTAAVVCTARAGSQRGCGLLCARGESPRLWFALRARGESHHVCGLHCARARGESPRLRFTLHARGVTTAAVCSARARGESPRLRFTLHARGVTTLRFALRARGESYHGCSLHCARAGRVTTAAVCTARGRGRSLLHGDQVEHICLRGGGQDAPSLRSSFAGLCEQDLTQPSPVLVLSGGSIDNPQDPQKLNLAPFCCALHGTNSAGSALQGLDSSQDSTARVGPISSQFKASVLVSDFCLLTLEMSSLRMCLAGPHRWGHKTHCGRSLSPTPPEHSTREETQFTEESGEGILTLIGV